jgi:predicted nucleotidyltransferase
MFIAYLVAFIATCAQVLLGIFAIFSRWGSCVTTRESDGEPGSDVDVLTQVYLNTVDLEGCAEGALCDPLLPPAPRSCLVSSLSSVAGVVASPPSSRLFRSFPEDGGCQRESDGEPGSDVDVLTQVYLNTVDLEGPQGPSQHSRQHHCREGPLHL